MSNQYSLIEVSFAEISPNSGFYGSAGPPALQRIAVEIGDIIKWTRSVNEIDRLGQAILKVSRDRYPNSAITAARQQGIYEWLCSIGATALVFDERCKRISEF